MINERRDNSLDILYELVWNRIEMKEGRTYLLNWENKEDRVSINTPSYSILSGQLVINLFQNSGKYTLNFFRSCFLDMIG